MKQNRYSPDGIEKAVLGLAYSFPKLSLEYQAFLPTEARSLSALGMGLHQLITICEKDEYFISGLELGLQLVSS